MTNTNATNFRKNLFEYLNQAAMYNDVINVNTKAGNVVVLSEEEYSGMMETLYLMANPATAKEVLEAKNALADEFVEYDPSVAW